MDHCHLLAESMALYYVTAQFCLELYGATGGYALCYYIRTISASIIYTTYSVWHTKLDVFRKLNSGSLGAPCRCGFCTCVRMCGRACVHVSRR